MVLYTFQFHHHGKPSLELGCVSVYARLELNDLYYYYSNVGTNFISSRHLLLLLGQQFIVSILLWNDCTRNHRAQALSIAANPCHRDRLVLSVCCWAFHCLTVWLDLEVLSCDTRKWQVHLPCLAWWLCGFVRRSTGFASTMRWKRARCFCPSYILWSMPLL